MNSSTEKSYNWHEFLLVRSSWSESKGPPLAKGCYSAIETLYENSFSVKAAELWNILPKTINTVAEHSKQLLGNIWRKFPIHIQPRVK
jgi:hypothetical protein